MENEAYKWLREWLNNGGWGRVSGSKVWCLDMADARLYSSAIVCFRDDMRQLLDDAEAGRKLREGA